MRRLSDLPRDEAAAELRACCAAPAWVERMLSQRPFKDRDEVFAAAERIWWDLPREEWLAAFAAHPVIGAAPAGHGADATEGAVTGGRSGGWAADEQSGMRAADDRLRAEMARANRDYEARFGWIYLVCATGRSAEELLALARRRLANAPDDELRIAAGEQARITALRLAKLLEIGS